MSNYPTNLTEKQWQVIKNIVEPQERNRKSSLKLETLQVGRHEVDHCAGHE